MRQACVQSTSRVAATGGRSSGVLLFDKPGGISSQAAVSRVKRLLGVAKAGHTGTLDPLATGLLPVCVGEATKFSHLLLEADKTYEAGIRLGVTTTTGDREGAPIAVSPVRVGMKAVQAALRSFVGDVSQVPPMYSALKQEGRPLYSLARKGIDVPRAPRTVQIRSIELQCLAGDVLSVRIVCGKGTYVRVLAEDIGRALGCGASLDSLRRTAVGPFSVHDSVTLEGLESLPPDARVSLLLLPDSPLARLPRVEVDAGQAQLLLWGRPVQDTGPALEAGMVSLYERHTGRFLGVGTRDASGSVAPRRLMHERSGGNNA